jgi:Domain of unknown function (DUF932)
MSDDIFKDNFAGVTPAWHRIGHALNPGTKAAEAMVIAGQADWDVRAIPLAMVGVDSQGLYVIVRNDEGTMRVAADQMVQEHYAPISNEEVFTGMVDMLVGEGLDVDAAGVLGRLGNRAFMTFRAEDIELPGNEKYQRYLIALVHHTGRDGVRILGSGFRVVCANTEAAALKAAGNHIVTIEHNKASIERFYDNAASARETLNLLHNWDVRMEKVAASLQTVPFNTMNWLDVKAQYLRILPKSLSDRNNTIRVKMDQSLMNAWTAEVANAKLLDQPFTSLWTARQAISNYAQHMSRGSERQKDNRSIKMGLGEAPAMSKLLVTFTQNVASKAPRANADVIRLVSA